MNNLSDNEKRLLEFTGIIIIHSNRWPVISEDHNGIILSDIVISEKLVPKYMDRFYIAHYLRNQMHLGFERHDPIKNEFVPIIESFYFSDYDSYIRRKAMIISNVIYHFISKNYYKLYINYPDQCYPLVSDKRLSVHLDLLVDKLKSEGLSFPLHYRM